MSSIIADAVSYGKFQSLTRTRPIAGNLALGEQFQALAGAPDKFCSAKFAAGCLRPDWKEKIHRMRMRIEKERTPAGKNDLAIKTGKGGLMDVEFIAQILCLEQGWQEANTLHALQRGREGRRIAKARRTDPKLSMPSTRRRDFAALEL